MKLLFNSGNPTPRLSFSGFNEFEEWIFPLNMLGTKEYRAALYIRDIHLRYSDDHPAPWVEFTADGFVGFTPLRFMVSKFNLMIAPFRRCEPGLGSFDIPEISPVTDSNGVDGIQIKHQLQFKLNGKLDLFIRAITFRWAPSAWMEIDYRIYKSGSVEIRFLGSAIPSQAHYINWNGLDQNDMICDTSLQIIGFLDQSRSCTKAPGELQFTWQSIDSPC